MYRLITLLLMLLPQAVFAYNTPLIVLTTFSQNSLGTLISDYQAKYPDVKIKILHRHEDAALRLLNDSTHDIDMVISTSIPIFEQLKQSNALMELPSVSEKFANAEVKATLQQFNKKIALLGYSRYGFMWNQRYLEKHNLDRPSSWESLTHPQYFQHLIMATLRDPSLVITWLKVFCSITAGKQAGNCCTKSAVTSLLYPCLM
ncbi:ABC transporter substrate-binding protein [Photobacterium sanguinicancri]|uniref:ABC transporter substrate-binding protein n=1 Tax=Photobacterium sanguinicancri TaxID=875932 RepID=UPI0007883EAC|nr:ABC transporter substrate-binding protein [Photobacterium sanguinicancri]KXI24112.1 hypothetical protein AS132_03200 [Photobacterium sanguinicancri]